MVNASEFSVHVEQLLVKSAKFIYNINVQMFEPTAPVGTVVFYHAFDGNGRDFQMQASYLATLGYRVICPDMLGRGASAFVALPQVYTLRLLVESAAAVLARYVNGDCAVVAEGWGAVIALLSTSLARTRVTHWVCTELTLDYRVEEDPAIARAIHNSGRRFNEISDALLAVAGPDTLARSAQELLTHRLRSEGGQLLPHHDDEIINQIAVFKNRNDDLRPRLRALTGRLLLAYSSHTDMRQALALCNEAPERRSVVYAKLTTSNGLTPAAATLLSDFFKS